MFGQITSWIYNSSCIYMINYEVKCSFFILKNWQPKICRLRARVKVTGSYIIRGYRPIYLSEADPQQLPDLTQPEPTTAGPAKTHKIINFRNWKIRKLMEENTQRNPETNRKIWEYREKKKATEKNISDRHRETKRQGALQKDREIRLT